MSTFATIPSELGLTTTWEQKHGSQWLVTDSGAVPDIAAMMLARDARFVTITAMQVPDDESIRLDYHWDLDGELLTFTVLTADNQVPSIYELCPAADWIEREIHEFLAIDFEGREYEPLLLRPGDKAGVCRREEDE
jgi:NADH:ubiquinone oxidoreductase subunit C